jgi:energy-converting hydrogenase B subunit G
MGLYDLIINRLHEIERKAKEQEPVTNVSASSTLAAEMTLISSVLIAAIMLRKISDMLMVVVVLALVIGLVAAMPLMPRLRKEQDDSFHTMIFYAMVTLGVLTALFYWGTANV